MQSNEEQIDKDSLPDAAARLTEWMVQSKPYLNPDLRLMDLREVLPMNRTYLSQFIHDEFDCSFFQFVNRYRIEEAKREKGYSLAWLHHRGRNPHHWAYWADNFSEGLTIYPMPKDDFVEMVCDFLAAGRAYQGENFSYSSERTWWLKEREGGCSGMNPINKQMLDIIFSDLEYAENHLLAGCPTSLITMNPEQLIKTGYFQEVWSSCVARAAQNL